ncbi:hypothetical protein EW146_g8419 [Bondarzewia mesenterica]|uniref:Uncharacterized protein n=1 Tax=Bondarzewia mesenterica TaxID=1095465 RepID=A0A4S4LEJ2_9AGAM|nr:hypothetical protein EW146_g8419 [Bondarzewia mesenterica]
MAATRLLACACSPDGSWPWAAPIVSYACPASDGIESQHIHFYLLVVHTGKCSPGLLLAWTLVDPSRSSAVPTAVELRAANDKQPNLLPDGVHRQMADSPFERLHLSEGVQLANILSFAPSVGREQRGPDFSSFSFSEARRERAVPEYQAYRQGKEGRADLSRDANLRVKVEGWLPSCLRIEPPYLAFVKWSRVTPSRHIITRVSSVDQLAV